jgi:hypothetical protein
VAVDHVVLRTADPDAALALYGSGLGIRLALDQAFDGIRMLFFRTGGVTLECVRDPSVGDATCCTAWRFASGISTVRTRASALRASRRASRERGESPAHECSA